MNGVFNFFSDKSWVCEIKNRSEQKIVYKKTAEWYIEWQRATRNGTSSDNKWQRVVQRVTTNDSEWQRTATSGTTNYIEWQWVVQPVTTSGNEWQRVTMNDNEWYNKWKQIKVILGFRMKQLTTMQCKTTIYSATCFWNYNVKQNIGRNSTRGVLWKSWA